MKFVFLNKNILNILLYNNSFICFELIKISLNFSVLLLIFLSLFKLVDLMDINYIYLFILNLNYCYIEFLFYNFYCVKFSHNSVIKHFLLYNVTFLNLNYIIY